MRHALLAATMLIAGSIVIGDTARADEHDAMMKLGRVNISLSGDLRYGLYLLDNDDLTTGEGAAQTTAEYSGFAIKNLDSHVAFSLAMPFDNGLVAGYSAALDANANFDENYAFVEGGFGRLAFGVTNGVAEELHVGVPDFVPGNNIDDPNVYNIARVSTEYEGYTDHASSLSTKILLDEEAYKLSYTSVPVGGFTLGFSFTPDIGIDDVIVRDGDVNVSGDNSFDVPTRNRIRTKMTDVISVGLNYEQEFLSSMALRFSAAYLVADGVPGVQDDPEIFSAGLQYSWESLTIGFGYKLAEDITAARNMAAPNSLAVYPNQEVISAGLAYTEGPWTVGFAYRQADVSSSAPTFTGSKTSHEAWQVGGGYKLGPGLQTGLDLQYVTDKDPDAVTPELDSFSIGFVMALSF